MPLNLGWFVIQQYITGIDNTYINKNRMDNYESSFKASTYTHTYKLTHTRNDQ